MYSLYGTHYTCIAKMDDGEAGRQADKDRQADGINTHTHTHTHDPTGTTEKGNRKFGT